MLTDIQCVVIASIDRHSIECQRKLKVCRQRCRPCANRGSTKARPRCRSSVDCGSIEVSIASINRHSITGVNSTHDPLSLVPSATSATCCCQFCHKKICETPDIIDLGWLPFNENRDLNLCKTTFKAMYDVNWLAYLRVTVRHPNRTLRSSAAVNLEVPKHSSTLQDQAVKVLNSLPVSYISLVSAMKTFRIFRECYMTGRLNRSFEELFCLSNAKFRVPS